MDIFIGKYKIPTNCKTQQKKESFKMRGLYHHVCYNIIMSESNTVLRYKKIFLKYWAKEIFFVVKNKTFLFLATALHLKTELYMMENKSINSKFQLIIFYLLLLFPLQEILHTFFSYKLKKRR